MSASPCLSSCQHGDVELARDEELSSPRPDEEEPGVPRGHEDADPLACGVGDGAERHPSGNIPHSMVIN